MKIHACRYSVYAYIYKCIQQIELYTERDNKQTTKTTKTTKTNKTTKTTKTTKSKMAQKNAEQFSFETKEGEAQIGKYIYTHKSQRKILLYKQTKYYLTYININTNINSCVYYSIWRHVRRSCETSTTFEKTS